MKQAQSAALTDTGFSTLRLDAVSVHYGGLKVLQDVSLSIGKGDLLGLIGPNGAGKTTLVNALTGFAPVTRGAVRADDRDITRWSTARRARTGVVRTFQGSRFFASLTVAENVEVGGVAIGLSRRHAQRRAAEALDIMGLQEVAQIRADALPQGYERRLGIARVLATRPTFVLLDEPAAGLDESESRELVSSIRQMTEQLGCGVLLIEHDMAVVMTLCERLHVLNYGQTIADGPRDDVRNDPEVVRAYLGTE